MRKNRLFFNGRLYTQAGESIVADSMAVSGKRIVAVGRNLRYDPDFRSYQKIDLKGRAVIPGFVDSHTHIYFLAMSLGNVKLDGLTSVEDVLSAIGQHSRKLGKDEWVVGDGFSPDRWKKYVHPDRFMLDRVTGGRPAALYSKDQHVMWVNSKALELAGITASSPDPAGGRIERLEGNEPSGILKAVVAYTPVERLVKDPPDRKKKRVYRDALQLAYSKGVIGVHSFDGPEAFPFFDRLSREGKLGLRINYYHRAEELSMLEQAGLGFGYGNDFFRLSGVKIFSDGSLGSQSALCFNRYKGSNDNYGVETNTVRQISAYVKRAARLNLPCAIHAIGDKAISNVIGCYETAPRPKGPARHRIEHLQMIRRSDIARVKRLGIVASMQPSHCPSDIGLIEKYWGSRGRNCFIFNTLLAKGIPLTFGSDAPIEPLDPIAGIDAAVNRKAPKTRKSFYPKERISVEQAIFGFTAGPAYAAGQEHELGYLLPGYFADFVVLSDDIYKIAGSKIKNVSVLATFFDGRPVFVSGDCDFLS
ncbi:MAG: amidohydrolase [Candidatus Zixiibacteriota bacterium]|nr:MAG: amidohydrolase [candidate division Zixibacteria bacterium]